MRERLRALLWTLRHPVRIYGPRCGATGPDKLPDCGTCIAPRGHEHHGGPSPDWHADGTGYIWNDHEGRWSWMGPLINLREVYGDHPESYDAVFTEDPLTPGGRTP